MRRAPNIPSGMYLFMCVCIYVCVCMHTCMCICMYVCMCFSVSVYIYTRACIIVCARIVSYHRVFEKLSHTPLVTHLAFTHDLSPHTAYHAFIHIPHKLLAQYLSFPRVWHALTYVLARLYTQVARTVSFFHTSLTHTHIRSSTSLSTQLTQTVSFFHKSLTYVHIRFNTRLTTLLQLVPTKSPRRSRLQGA